jgi:hypothetical protein
MTHVDEHLNKTNLKLLSQKITVKYCTIFAVRSTDQNFIHSTENFNESPSNNYTK